MMREAEILNQLCRQGEKTSLSDVAKKIHVSTFYLCKIFKKATGLTLIEFRNRLRIESAKNLLMSQELTVSEIAYKVGFQSLAHFNRLFRRLVGRSPTGFRHYLSMEGAPPRPSPN
jgi:AraC-like DNA-binding protein